MNHCAYCKHWRGNGEAIKERPLLPINQEYRDGECAAMLTSPAVDIHASGGWDGANVDYFRTVASFGCNLWEPL